MSKRPPVTHQRNGLCFCGSRKKFKHCCFKKYKAALTLVLAEWGASRPITDRLYVWLEYTIDDPLGRAEVGYRYPHGQLIPLTNGEAVPVQSLTPGE
ncbi:MAG: SEC-C domain-containing protein, partial [Planctomycetia bacterium]|nr:SEC-C domain-containing protein [Planctomycetia bacterium]